MVGKIRQGSRDVVGVGFGFIFVSFWSLITLAFDGIIGYGIYHQIRSIGFEKMDGRVLASRVETRTDSDGTTFRPIVQYEYTVNGQLFQNDVVRYGMAGSPGNYSREIVEQYPANQPALIYVNTSSPSESVLIRGIEGGDLFMLMFMTPFNLIMIGGWIFLVSSLISRPVQPPGFPVSNNDHRVRVRLGRLPSLLFAAGIVFALTFVSIFIVGFTWGYNASLNVMSVVWGIILTPALVVFCWSSMRNLSGRYDLVLDRVRQKVDLPIIGERKQVVTHSADEIAQTIVQPEKTTDAGGDLVIQHVVLFEFNNAKTRPARLVECDDKEMADGLADWLNQNWLKVPPSKSQ